MVRQAYLNGFMAKCAEYGIDGEMLLKSAQFPKVRIPNLLSGLYTYGKGAVQVFPAMLTGNDELVDKARRNITVGGDRIDDSMTRYKAIAKSIAEKLKRGALMTPASLGIRR